MAITAADVVGREDARRHIRLPGRGRGSLRRRRRGRARDRQDDGRLAAIEQAEARGLRVLRARPAESESRLAFSSLADLLGPVLQDVLGELPPPQRRALDAALLIDDGARADRRAVGAGLLSALRALAAQKRLLVAIDDSQWLDPSSAAASVCSPAPARGAGRPGHRAAPRRGLELEAGISARTRPLRVGRAARVPGPERRASRSPRDDPAAAAAAPTSRALRRQPLLRAGAGAVARRAGGGTLPPSLDALVRGRMATLPEHAQLALLVAAAASQPSVELVENAVGSPDTLAAAEAEGIVELDHGSVRFTHPLLASGAYSAAEPSQRREAQSLLGGLVRDPEERARHLAAAATGPDEKVGAALEAAATRARARGAPAAAAELSEEAAQLTPPEGEPDRHRRLADAGYYHFESGDSRRALALLEELAAQLPAGPERASVLTRLARVRSYSDDLGVATRLFLQAAVEAGDDRALLARAHEGAAGQLFRQRRRLDKSVEHARRAAELARGLGDDALLALALSSQLLAEATLGRLEAPGDARGGGRPPTRGRERSGSSRNRRSRRRSHGCGGEEPGGVKPTAEQLIDRGRAAGDEGSLAYVYVMLAQAECLLGDFEQGWRNAEAAREIAEQAGQEAVGGYALAMQALADAHRGRVNKTHAKAAARQPSSSAWTTELTPVTQFARAALGLLELALGRPAEAAEHLSPLVAFSRAERICEPGLTRYVPDQVEVLVELGRLEEAGELLDWYEGNAGAVGPSRCDGLVAPVSRPAGRC